MKGWMSKYWMISPMRRPSPPPMTRTRKMTAAGFQPCWRSVALTIIDSATTAPTDRSMPPVRITNVMPTASTIRKVLSMKRFRNTWPERKLGYMPAPTANMAMKSPRVARVGA